MTTSIRQTVTLAARPSVIFETLMDSKKHAAFTRAPAKISRKPGGAFSAYGKYISGFNIAIVTNKSIVQAWRAATWPKGDWSVVTYTLKSAPGGKTKITFEQHGVPKKVAKEVAAGWVAAYWEPLKAMIKAAKAPARPKAKPKKAATKKKTRAKAKPKKAAAKKKTAKKKVKARPRKAAIKKKRATTKVKVKAKPKKAAARKKAAPKKKTTAKAKPKKAAVKRKVTKAKAKPKKAAPKKKAKAKAKPKRAAAKKKVTKAKAKPKKAAAKKKGEGQS